jgi:hypothetical protein
MAETWAGVPEYSAALAQALGEEGGRAFLDEATDRHEEFGARGQQLIGGWLNLVEAS